MKFNWGTGIFIFFTIFVIASLTQVFISRKYIPELVKKDYYVDDLHLNDIVISRENVSSLKGFSWIQSNDSLMFVLPHGSNIDGFIELINPMSEKQDKNIKFQLGQEQKSVSFSTEQLKNGKWNFHINWKEGDKTYLYENTFIKS